MIFSTFSFREADAIKELSYRRNYDLLQILSIFEEIEPERIMASNFALIFGKSSFREKNILL